LAGCLDLGGPPPAQHRATSLDLGEIDLTEADEPAEPIFVPYTELSDDALRGVLESFVLREGTEYGERDVSLDQKVAQVTRQLQRGEAQIVFDPESETIDIVVAADKGRVAGAPLREKP
jgi:uncharacterized protein YheU (UPF0270 family)